MLSTTQIKIVMAGRKVCARQAQKMLNLPGIPNPDYYQEQLYNMTRPISLPYPCSADWDTIYRAACEIRVKIAAIEREYQTPRLRALLDIADELVFIARPAYCN